MEGGASFVEEPPTCCQNPDRPGSGVVRQVYATCPNHSHAFFCWYICLCTTLYMLLGRQGHVRCLGAGAQQNKPGALYLIPATLQARAQTDVEQVSMPLL